MRILYGCLCGINSAHLYWKCSRQSQNSQILCIMCRNSMRCMQYKEIIFVSMTVKHGPGSVVGIATAYGLDGPGIEYRWGARLSAPVQTGPEAHPASCTMGTGSFPGVRCGRGVTMTPHPLPVPRSKIE